MNEKVIIKKDLKTVGFSDFQAAQIIRIVKVQLKNKGMILYENSRIGFVPFDTVSRYLLGVLLPSEEASVDGLKKQVISLPELKKRLKSEHVAKTVIRKAQREMVDKGCDFYRNVRHWLVPREAVNQILFGNHEEDM